MKPIPISDLPQEIIDKMSPEDRADNGLKSTAEWEASGEKKRMQIETKAEKEIQSQVEAWLIHHGFERRTKDDIARGMSESGYFIHLYEAKRNPILLDLLILSHTGRYLELELKTATGPVTPEQKCLIAYGGSLARSAEEAIEIIKEWINGLQKQG